jgi:hypothetical protein
MEISRGAQTPRDSILDELHYAGGTLSHSELVLTTHLPYNIVSSVVEQLEREGEVEVIKDKVPVVRLRGRYKS